MGQCGPDPKTSVRQMKSSQHAHEGCSDDWKERVDN